MAAEAVIIMKYEQKRMLYTLTLMDFLSRRRGACPLGDKGLLLVPDASSETELPR